MDCVQTVLNTDFTSTAEYSMAEWKKICDKAMAKWRPYAKKSAAALGVDELRFVGYGSSIHRVVDPTRREISAADKFDAENDWMVLEDVRARFHILTLDDDKTEKLMDFLVRSTSDIQRYRCSLISAWGHPEVRGDFRLAVLKAAQDNKFDPAIVKRQFKLDAEKFFELATMSPLRLLQIVTTFICSGRTLEVDTFWPAVAAFGDQILQENESSFERRQSEIFRLLSVVSLCPRCHADDTKPVWRKTRSADEPFQFLVVCRKCHSSTIIE
jgi:hypothetical protein